MARVCPVHGTRCVRCPSSTKGPAPRRHASYPVAVGRVSVVRVHRHRSGELHADVGPGQEERARFRGHGRMQIDGHANLHLQIGTGTAAEHADSKNTGDGYSPRIVTRVYSFVNRRPVENDGRHARVLCWKELLRQFK